jgi:hypothetical protein
MQSTQPNRGERTAAADAVEPSPWWGLIGIALFAAGGLALFAAHLILDATSGRAWAWALMAVPTALWAASVAALFAGSSVPLRERLAAVPAAILGYSPQLVRQKQQSHGGSVEPE